MGKWTPRREAPEPLEGNVVAIITGSTAVWFVLFLVQLPFYGRLDAHGHLWWLWTCLTGGSLGLYGIWYVRKREAAIRRAAAAKAAEATEATNGTAGTANEAAGTAHGVETVRTAVERSDTGV